YPISLLYVSNIPVIFASALFANVYLISQLLWNHYKDQNIFWINLLGTYGSDPETGRIRPTGGLVYYMVAPRGLGDVLEDPLRALAYLLIMVFSCAIFARLWLEVGGLDPATVARQIVDAGLQVPGFRRSYQAVKRLLERYIPTTTVLGGILVGLLAAVADFFGTFGTGTGILLSVGIIYQYYQVLAREQLEEMYPALARLLGTK
ncbi:MAG TPA: preprotein translocase subunit SecY, partial [Candidatus Bathyarchaeota archaeon]|nr:preprotein translocase subunit SecY [Candidatus Bathyarchaeota archaeon]HEW89939.1 preprotein translocase subunit SecY [Candidatus Bathyarchaeota archaeon]